MTKLLTIHMLHRDRIFQELKAMEEYPLTVIAAPMGYGKTMAVTDYFCRTGHFGVMVPLTAAIKVSDEDYFWLLLTGALREKVPTVCRRLEAMGFPENPMQVLRLLEMLKGLELKEDVCLILDDFQYVTSAQILALISEVVLADIPRLHLVLAGREYPELPIEEWEMKKLCYTVNADTLAFTPEEAFSYLDRIGFQGDSKVRDRIVSSTDGWIAAIYLMANDYTRFQNIDYHATIYQMLRNSLYHTCTEEEKVILMKLSLCESFSTEMLTEIFHSREVLAFVGRLYRNNALIVRSSDGEYRFHDLFRGFLQSERELSGLDIRPFAGEVGHWASEHGQRIVAFRFWMMAEDYDSILKELEEAPVMEIFSMKRGVLERLFREPEEKMKTYPIAYLKYVFYVCVEISQEQGRTMLERFQERCGSFAHPRYGRDHLLAESYVLGTVLSFNDLDDIIQAMDRAADLLGEKKSVIRIRTSNLTYGSPHMTYAYYNKPGVYRHIMDSFVHRFDSHIQIADGNGYGADCVALAEYSLETGKLEQVEYLAEKALYKADQYDQVCMSICAYLTLGRLYIIKQEPEHAREIICRLEGLLEKIRDSSKLLALDCAVGYLYAELEEDQNIPKWLYIGDFDSDSSLHQRLAFNYIVYGKGLLLKGDYMRLDFLTEQFAKMLKSRRYQLGYIHNYIFSAVCSLNLPGGDLQSAAECLQKAVDIAVQDEIVMPFVEYHKYLIPLLDDKKIRCPEWFREKIEILTGAEKKPGMQAEKGELLTRREMEIMDLLEQGLSSARIADALFISQYTVKRHMQNIYRKLEVPNKTLALNRYREIREQMCKKGEN